VLGDVRKEGKGNVVIGKRANNAARTKKSYRMPIVRHETKVSPCKVGMVFSVPVLK
jgi:hypothetical protein